MAETVSITVFFDVQRCSPNRHIHPFLQREESRFAYEYGRAAWVAAGRPTLPPPVLVNIIVRRRRRIDPDHIQQCCRKLIDSLFKQGIVEDDRSRFVQYGEIRQEKLPTRHDHASVTFEVTSLAEEVGDGG